jgi:hypothetical protein
MSRFVILSICTLLLSFPCFSQSAYSPTSDIANSTSNYQPGLALSCGIFFTVLKAKNELGPEIGISYFFNDKLRTSIIFRGSQPPNQGFAGGYTYYYSELDLLVDYYLLGDLTSFGLYIGTNIALINLLAEHIISLNPGFRVSADIGVHISIISFFIDVGFTYGYKLANPKLVWGDTRSRCEVDYTGNIQSYLFSEIGYKLLRFLC